MLNAFWLLNLCTQPHVSLHIHVHNHVRYNISVKEWLVKEYSDPQISSVTSTFSSYTFQNVKKFVQNLKKQTLETFWNVCCVQISVFTQALLIIWDPLYESWCHHWVGGTNTYPITRTLTSRGKPAEYIIVLILLFSSSWRCQVKCAIQINLLNLTYSNMIPQAMNSFFLIPDINIQIFISSNYKTGFSVGCFSSDYIPSSLLF